MRIVNLTRRNAAPEQVAAGVIEPEQKDEIRQLLTFENLHTFDELMVMRRACRLARIAKDAGADAAMIGDTPGSMLRALEDALVSLGVRPVYAFSTREVVEEVQEDGSVRKTAIFRHKGFVCPLG